MAKKATKGNRHKKQQSVLDKVTPAHTSIDLAKLKEEIEVPPKDEEEIELEKLVFGDLAGFEANLKEIDNLQNISSSDEEEEEYSDDDNINIGDGLSGKNNGLEDLQDDMLFFVDDSNKQQQDNDGDVEMKENNNDSEEENSTDENSSDSAAWDDSDDERMNINLLQSSKIRKLRTSNNEEIINSKLFINRLRAQFEKIYPRPLWADQVDESDDDESSGSEANSSDEEPVTDAEDDTEVSTTYNSKSFIKLIESNLSYRRQKLPKLLTPKNINISRLKDANYKHLSRAAIQTIKFHSTLPLLLTGGYDRTLRIYNIDGKNNNVVTTMFWKNCPIQNAYFAPNNGSNKVYLAGRRKFMYKLDLGSGDVEKITNLYGIKHLQKSFESFKISPLGKYIGLIGNNGYVNILSVGNGSFVKNFKIEGVVADFVWSSTEEILFITNNHGEVYEFAFNNNNVINKWQDENGIGITKLALGGKNDRYLAIGSQNGIVNIYDRLKGFKINDGKGSIDEHTNLLYIPKPLGTITNLVTTISSLEFNFDGQLLCIASRAKKDALRLVHIPSCSVYQNWPTSGTPLGKVTSVAFSPNSEMLAVGNEAGKARLFQLNDY